MIPPYPIDDTVNSYAYTPPAIVVQEASASTSGLNDFIYQHTALDRSFFSANKKDTAVYATRRYVDINDPIDELANEIIEKVEATRQAEAAYRERIKELIIDASFDGICLNKDSERDFWDFLKPQGFFMKGKLYLLDNGNIRALWKNEIGEQIGLQFLGNKTAQYVIFKHRSETNMISRVCGRDSIKGIRHQIEAFDLDNLITA